MTPSGAASTRSVRVKLWRNAEPDERHLRNSASDSGDGWLRKTTRPRIGSTAKWDCQTNRAIRGQHRTLNGKRIP